MAVWWSYYDREKNRKIKFFLSGRLPKKLARNLHRAFFGLKSGRVKVKKKIADLINEFSKLFCLFGNFSEIFFGRYPRWSTMSPKGALVLFTRHDRRGPHNIFALPW